MTERNEAKRGKVTSLSRRGDGSFESQSRGRDDEGWARRFERQMREKSDLTEDRAKKL
jgi:hypothetical protein